MKDRIFGERGPRPWLLITVLAAALAAIATGCGGGGGGGGAAATTQAPPADTGAPADTGVPADTGAVAGGTGQAIKVAILSDCEGAFGAFYEADIGGAQAAFAKYAGGVPAGAKPSDGMTNIVVAGTPVEIVGYGCSNDTADKAIEETRRLMEQVGADILIGPLSGDEGIAVANYAKENPDKTFINGTSGAQDTTLKVQAPNFFRFNADGAQWSAGLGDYAYNDLGWRTAAVIGDDYSFPYTSLAGFIAEFCAIGGSIPPENRIWPPLGETDYSSYIAQLPTDVDGIMVGIGGSGLLAFLQQYEQQVGALDPNKFMGNVFWPDPIILEPLGDQLAGSVAAVPTAGDSTDPAAVEYNQFIDELYPVEGVKGTGPSVFTYNYFNAAWGLIQGLEAVAGDISGGQAELQAALADVQLDAAYGQIQLDENRQAIQDNYVVQIVPDGNGDGVADVKTIRKIPSVDQTFGGVFSPDTPSPDRENPACEKLSTPPPWVGNFEEVTFGG